MATYTPDDAATRRQVLDNRLRDLRTQHYQVDLELRSQDRLLRVAKGKKHKALQYLPGQAEKDAQSSNLETQHRQRCAQLSVQLEEIETAIDVMEEDLAAMPAEAAEEPAGDDETAE
jgi:hypothetical protein